MLISIESSSQFHIIQLWTCLLFVLIDFLIQHDSCPPLELAGEDTDMEKLVTVGLMAKHVR